MAAANPAKNIKDEATCSICLDLFKDPVTTECGHSFCRECIAQHCEEKEIDIVCPLCNKVFQKSNLRPNRELKNIVDSIPQLLSSERLRNPIEENMCERHGDPLKFYCKEDQTPVCMVCERSQAHRGHTVVPMEEAVQEYWETITEQLEVIESTYKKLHLLVNKDWKRRPQSAGEKAHEKLKRLTDDVGILLKEDIKGPRQRFEDLPSQTQPPEPDLKHFRPGKKIAVETELQGHKERENTRERVAEKQETASHVIHICEDAPTPKYGLDHASLDPTIHNISNTTEDIHHKMDITSGSISPQDLTSVIPRPQFQLRRKDSISPGENVALPTELQGCEVDVALDPATAHPRLILSADRKSVKLGDTRQKSPNNPERFDIFAVLGSEGFTSGRHYWEMEVGPGKDWTIGVAKDSVQRKGKILLKPHFGIWALVSSEIPWEPRKIGVYLNYESGEVRFYNAENMTLISSLTATFTGRVVPFFRLRVVGSHIKLSPARGEYFTEPIEQFRTEILTSTDHS